MTAQQEWTLNEVDNAVRDGTSEAEHAVEWFWANGPVMERHTAFIRHARAWCQQPHLRTLFERLRPAAPRRESNLFPSLMNWLALWSALGLEDEILAWFDDRVAAGDVPLPAMSRLRRSVLVRGRAKDWLAFGSPLASVNELLETVAQTRELFAEGPVEVLEEELDEVDCEVALWRRVAERARADQVEDVDLAIDASERAKPIRSWLAQPDEALIQGLLRHLFD